MSILLKDNLESLNSNISYWKFDKRSVNCLDDSSFWGKVAQQLNEVYGLNNISASIVKALCYIKSLQLQPNFDNVMCEYLCYWLGNKISNDLSNKESFSSVIDLLYAELGDIYKENKCKNIIFQINSTDFQKLKDVYDYKQNYNTISAAIRDYGNECSEKFRDYLNKSYESYEELYTKCERSHEEYCEHFKKIIPEYPGKKLEKLICNLKESISVPVREERGPGAHEGHINARGVDGIRGGLDVYLVPRDGMVDGPSDKAGSTSNVGVSNTIMGIFFPLVVISLAFCLLYNFTPIGSMIQSFLKKKRIIEHNMDDIGTHEINDNFSDYEEKYDTRSLFNIAYHGA
ncbi:PIR Superfamily Protein [Plasmodium ovale wallikeri]|uniref:PIR Superfamily Protein n=1 Tax=Plasmodium ovale wallikeri TaxID=864142 RepID=A0A1A9A556_PLAOA|nr:PIR Superfamily Protein [Plasmodium ovale wallikeri]